MSKTQGALFGQVNSNKIFKRATQLRRKVQIFAAKGPGYHFTYGRWRLKRWLGSKQIAALRLDDQALFAQLDLEKPGLNQVKRAVATGNYQAAQASILAYFQTRSAPHFFFKPTDIERNISLLDEEQKESSIRAADEIGQNIFCFRRAEAVKFQNGIDWNHRPHGNVDWTWDLNRHAYFETLGRAYWYTSDERYAKTFRRLLLDWLAHNPVSVDQPSWSSVFEVAFRINTWLWAFYYFRSTLAFDPETNLAFLKGLFAHGRYLEANLELHAHNNHLLLEAKALAMLGLLFPEFKHAKKWRRRGFSLLYEQVKAQVCPDGVHAEYATLYQRIIAGELLELLVLLENNDLSAPPEIAALWAQMVEFELWVTKPNGLVPLWGDSALEDTHLRFSAASAGPAFLKRNDLKSVAPPLNETDIWLLGFERVQQFINSPVQALELNSRAFPKGGYFVLRHGRAPQATYLVFDCGPFGHKPVPIHGHADALSLELYAHGQTFLVDPGVYSTHLGHAWRNFFRGSQAHNTVVVDNQDQSTLVDIWRVHRPAQATLHQWISSAHLDFVDGSHNGYERLSEPITHRRQILFIKPEYWVVIDALTGRGRHCFDLYFHLQPGLVAQLEPQSGSLHARNKAQAGLTIIPLLTNDLQADLISGATAPIQGWVSSFSGEKQPAPTLRYRQQAVAPLQFCTLLYPASMNAPLTISSLDVESGAQSTPVEHQLTSLRIETDACIDYLLVDRGTARTRKTFAGYETDAQLVYIRSKKEDNTPLKVIQRGSTQILFQGHPLVETDRLVLDCEM